MKLIKITKTIFHPQIFLLLAALLFSWYSFNIWAFNNVTEADLIPHSGVLTQLDTVTGSIKFNRHIKPKYIEFTIDKNPNRKFDLQIGSNFRDRITSQVKVGDSIILFTLPQPLSRYFGFREMDNKVRKLSKANQVLFHDTALYHIDNFVLQYISLLASLTFFILFIRKLKKRLFRMDVESSHEREVVKNRI